jgi:hypothetical protein
MEYSALNPRGLRQSIDRLPLSPRLPNLNGKIVYCVEMFNRRVFMKELSKRLAKYAPGVKTVYKEKLEGFAGSDKELLDEIAQKADAAICGTVMGGGSGMYGVYWLIELEKRGIPLVYLVGEALPGDNTFKDVIQASAIKRGMPALRTIVVPLIEEYRVAKDLTEERSKKILLKIFDALTKPLTEEEKKAGQIVPQKQPRIAKTGTLAEIQDYFHNQRWTDGLPIIPPTEEMVKEFLKHTKHSPDEVVTTTMWPEELTVTVEKVAIVGVMAGCKPEYMPVLLAIVEAFGNSHIGVFLPSDSSPVLMTIVNGPIRNEIGMNAGRNAMGPCNRANATIGRFLTLSIISLGGLWPQINDLSAQGNPSRYCFCVPENEEKSPWKPFHVSMGHKPDESIVNILAGGWSHGNVPTAFRPIKATLDVIAGGNAGPIILMSPGMARLCADDGMSKEDVEQYIWEHASAPLSELKTSGFPTPAMNKYNDMPDDTLVPLYLREAVKVIIVGGESGMGIAQPWQMGAMSSPPSSVDKWR